MMLLFKMEIHNAEFHSREERNERKMIRMLPPA